MDEALRAALSVAEGVEGVGGKGEGRGGSINVRQEEITKPKLQIPNKSQIPSLESHVPNRFAERIEPRCLELFWGWEFGFWDFVHLGA